MSFPAQGPSRDLDDALDRRDDALYRTRRILFLVASGAVTASVGLGVVFAQELPGHAAAAQPAAGGAAAGSQQAAPASQGGSSQSGSSQSGSSRSQSAAPAAPRAPAPAPSQVVSGGS